MRLFCKTCTMIKCSGIASQRTYCWTAKATSASQISVSPLNIICNLSNLHFDFDQKFNIISSYMDMNICTIYHILIDIFQVLRSRSLRARQWGAVWARWGTFIFVFCDISFCIVWLLFFCIFWHLYFYFMTFAFLFYHICICILWQLYFRVMASVFVLYSTTFVFVLYSMTSLWSQVGYMAPEIIDNEKYTFRWGSKFSCAASWLFVWSSIIHPNSLSPALTGFPLAVSYLRWSKAEPPSGRTSQIS